MTDTIDTHTSIRPGLVWLDTNGNRIQAHGGSVHYEDGVYYWYGENKEKTVPGSGIWHWGVRAYSSTDLYNWEDRGLIIPPVEDDPESPLHPTQGMDRPHIIFNELTQKYVCWIKVMGKDNQQTQASTILTADSFLGPYDIVRTGLLPLEMNAGDFDLTVDPETKKAYYYFEKVHTDLVCAELTDDYTDVNGKHSTHMHHPGPPFTREAPAYFSRDGVHYLVTSGTTGYFPNFSEFANAPDYHGPWTVLGDAHPTDPTRTSFRSQITSVFKHPDKSDLYIALADRWLPQLPENMPNVFDSVATMASGAERPDPATQAPTDVDMGAVMAAGRGENTAIADYVWLPIRFDGDIPEIEWLEEWRVEDYS
ncbi:MULTISPECIES: family 43 glycosylhydrolase [unclassified Frondihabitans]|uniref:family 43 glycosylhydrolase n=1 Tax=unclassified Frondihabitans TaxID=2626248 RepID=UPI000F5077D2|nr:MULTISPECIES: family 43 glycosylhydrolase [unclassified Frondihabitans]RPE77807.1 glycosyl hydrolase family 43 [Frondihabitans sp. PhB153]RPF08086.1 glycosyl hydrolase family 43 [Frondihabitans sp. PhB161]